MRSVLCCPDKFRGSLSATEAATAFAIGCVRAGLSNTVELPLADGGEGTLDALLRTTGGERRRTPVTGPLGDRVVAEWGIAADGTAIIELAQASGLQLVQEQNDPLKATTRGTGELIAAAASAGATRAIVGVGGSATTDGGLGAIEVLEWQLPIPVTVACDVATSFTDAARAFGPQKGASTADVLLLSRRLEVLADELEKRTGTNVRRLPGAGAAGGAAGGLAALGAILRPGFQVVASACKLDTHLRSCEFVITGEGRLDSASFEGKVVGGVLRDARRHSRPVGVVVGSSALDLIETLPAGTPVVDLASLASDDENAMSRAFDLAIEGVERVAQFFR